MNKTLIEITEKHGIVLDEDGETKEIIKEGTDHSFEEILEKENEIETLEKEYENANNEFTKASDNNVFGGLLRVIGFSMSAVGSFLFSMSELPLVIIIGVPIFLVLQTEAFSVAGYGSIKGNNNRRKKASDKILDLESRISTANIALSNMKSKVEFKKEENLDIIEDIPVNLEEYVKNEEVKVKVKSLGKRK